jgi:hypothetical protein
MDRHQAHPCLHCSQCVPLQDKVSTVTKLMRWMRKRAASTAVSLAEMLTSEQQEGCLQRYLRWLAEHNWFRHLFTALILVNTVAMAVEYDGMSSKMQSDLRQLNFILTIAFACEVIIKVRPPLTTMQSKFCRQLCN